MRLFDFGRNNRLSVGPVCDDDNHGLILGWWLSGRVRGRYVSIRLPRFWAREGYTWWRDR